MHYQIVCRNTPILTNNLPRRRRIKPQISNVVKQPPKQPSRTFTPDITFTPDVPEQPQPEPKLPKSLIDLTPDQVGLYKILLSEYDSSKSDYLRYIRAIKSLKQGIRSSHTPEGRQIVNGLTARNAIIKLRAMFVLSD
jgi:hypothetical protein